MDAKEFGAFLAQVRRERNMTQAELAQQLHITDKAVSRWERGIGLPDINTLEPLADVLGKPMIYWVYKAARACPKLDDVLIATDDERIADACKTYDMRYIMTSPDHDTPTGRIWEVSTVEDADLYASNFSQGGQTHVRHRRLYHARAGPGGGQTNRAGHGGPHPSPRPRRRGLLRRRHRGARASAAVGH